MFRTKRRFVERGLDGALGEKKRPGARRKLSGKKEAILVTTACSTPPAGRVRWTLELLAGAMLPLTEHRHVGEVAFASRDERDATRDERQANGQPGNASSQRYRFESSKDSKLKSGTRDSNSRLQPWEGCTLPTELVPLELLDRVAPRRQRVNKVQPSRNPPGPRKGRGAGAPIARGV